MFRLRKFLKKKGLMFKHYLSDLTNLRLSWNPDAKLLKNIEIKVVKHYL